ncbi:Immunity-related GTPase family M protein [Plecturocebus cupreus]
MLMLAKTIEDMGKKFYIVWTKLDMDLSTGASQKCSYCKSEKMSRKISRGSRLGDSWQRSHTGRQRNSFGWRSCFAGAPARRFPVRSIRTEGLSWSHPHKENSNWKC